MMIGIHAPFFRLLGVYNREAGSVVLLCFREARTGICSCKRRMGMIWSLSLMYYKL